MFSQALSPGNQKIISDPIGLNLYKTNTFYRENSDHLLSYKAVSGVKLKLNTEIPHA